jgi:hypothetical protein
MSYEIIEHQIKQNLEPVRQGSMYFVPDVIMDQILSCAYKQGIVDGGIRVASLVDKACDAVQGKKP